MQLLNFNFDEFLFKRRYPLLILLAGLILVGTGILFFQKDRSSSSTKIEVLESADENSESGEITAEIAGEVVKPGVYKLSGNSRIDDLLILAGGFSIGADRAWTDKYLDRAAKLTDGQKIYIPGMDKQSDVAGAKTGGGDQSISSSLSSDSNSLININTAGLKELDTLPGIGPVYGQSIIEHRPYSNVEELLSKGALKKSVYEKVKNLVTIY